MFDDDVKITAGKSPLTSAKFDQNIKLQVDEKDQLDVVGKSMINCHEDVLQNVCIIIIKLMINNKLVSFPLKSNA